MKKLLTISFCLILMIRGFSQDLPAAYQAFKEKYPEGPALNKWDSLYLGNIPEKILPAGLRSDQLPPLVDNSALPYMRPVINQANASCGQAALVSYNYAYELACERNLPAMLPENQYPTHFTYNFQNGGNGWLGVSYFHTIEVLRLCGCMNVADYGGVYDDGRRWINGYDVYYNGMLNRIKGIQKIKTGTEEGILALKHWLHDHMGEGNHGGMASFYACSPWNPEILDADTPEGGKYVMTWFYPWAVHAMTIVGYNDSIRWDYNNDGQYTNHIDINEDSIMDPRDWEIGAFKFVNSYGEDWLDSGYCYLMYKCLAETFDNGGIWNQEVHILDIDPDYQPLMTYKITLKHDKRVKIRILAGASSDTSDVVPAWLMDFPIINYQGDEHYLQGNDTTEALKSLEFGLDITPLLRHLTPGEPAKFFFMVDENDPFEDGNGQITSFSLMDYTSGQQEISSGETPLAIENNSRTLVSLIHIPDYENVEIITETLPPYSGGEPYSVQLQAGGGQEPYSWELLPGYRMEQSSEIFPQANQQQVLYPLPADTIVAVPLGFSFPFFGETYDTLWMHVNGHIQFDAEAIPWPYLQEPELFFRCYRLIAPFEFDPAVIVAADNDGGWVELSETSATFRWKISLESLPGNTEVNFAARLHSNGNIEIIYGAPGPGIVNWLSGISGGNRKDFIMSPVSGSDYIPSGTKFIFYYQDLPEDIAVSPTGMLNVLPVNENRIYDLTFRVQNDHGLTAAKTLQFTSGPYLHFIINGAGTDRVEFGDTVVLDLEIRNGSPETLQGVSVSLNCSDPFVQLINATCSPGAILPGATINVPEAFSFIVSAAVPDQRDMLISATLISEGNTWINDLWFRAMAPVIKVRDYFIDTGDGILDPGETAPMPLTLQNSGGAPIDGVAAILIPLDPGLQVIGSPMQGFGTIEQGKSVTRTFTLRADEGIPDGTPVQIVVSTLSLQGLQTSDTLDLRVGKSPVLVLDLDPFHHSSPGIIESLNELQVIYSIDFQVSQSIFNFHSIFVCLGYPSTNHVLTAWEGHKLDQFLQGGGNLYLEGRKTWKDDPVTDVHPKFNIQWAGNATVFDTLTGIDGTFTQGMKILNAGAVPFNFYYIEPVEPAFTVLQDNNLLKPCVIAHDAGTYRTIGSLFEYGTLADISPGETLNLMKAYLEFFGIPVDPVEVEEQGGGKAWGHGGLVLFPNPASKWLSITPSLGWGRAGVGSDHSAARLEIFEMYGRKMTELENISSYPLILDISSLTPGMYILRMKSAKGFSGSVKFLKLAD